MLSVVETSSRKAHIFRYARSFDKLRMTRIILNFSTEKYQADNLAKLWQEFLSVSKLIAKIFGAVSRTTSLMWLSALIACKRCRCRNDGFCSDEEQGKAPWATTLVYVWYMSCFFAAVNKY